MPAKPTHKPKAAAVPTAAAAVEEMAALQSLPAEVALIVGVAPSYSSNSAARSCGNRVSTRAPPPRAMAMLTSRPSS